MVEYFVLTHLSSYKLLKRFPVEIRDTIRSNIQPMSGEHFAVCALDGRRAIAAGGVRKNEDGHWMAWFWVDEEKPHRYSLLRAALCELDRMQALVRGPLYAIVMRFNPTGQRLLGGLLGFEMVGEYTDLVDRAKSFYLYKRDYHGRESDVGGGVAGLSGNLG